MDRTAPKGRRIYAALCTALTLWFRLTRWVRQFFLPYQKEKKLGVVCPHTNRYNEQIKHVGLALKKRTRLKEFWTDKLATMSDKLVFDVPVGNLLSMHKSLVTDLDIACFHRYYLMVTQISRRGKEYTNRTEVLKLTWLEVKWWDNVWLGKCSLMYEQMSRQVAIADKMEANYRVLIVVPNDTDESLLQHLRCGATLASGYIPGGKINFCRQRDFVATVARLTNYATADSNSFIPVRRPFRQSMRGTAKKLLNRYKRIFRHYWWTCLGPSYYKYCEGRKEKNPKKAKRSRTPLPSSYAEIIVKRVSQKGCKVTRVAKTE